MMPEMDGHEVCRKLKADEKTRDIPVIFVTAMGQESDETRGLELGAVDYITKPISSAIVEARVKTHLSLRQQTRDLQEAKAVIEAQKDRMQDELNVAKNIQLSMLPQEFPAYPDHDEFMLHASMEAAREVGGDFYDFFFIDEDHLCVCIGDVSGKGVPAALFMAISKALIRSRAKNDLSTASILTHVNDEIDATNEAAMFVTVFLAIIDIRTGNMLYTNAGHNPSYITREAGQLERLDSLHGPVVGALGGVAYKEDSTNLLKGDLLLAYTDGVTEAMDSENNLFDESRLVDVLKAGDNNDPEQVIQSTLYAVKSFARGAEQSDDITLLSLLFNKEPAVEQAKVFSIKIPNSLGEIDTVNNAFTDFAQQSGIDNSVVQKIKLVFDELLNNTISYGYKDEAEHFIEVGVDLLEGRLRVTIEDDATPFNPLSNETPDTTLDIDERDIGGLGIHLVRNMMDEMTYKRGIDKNIITLIKHLDAE
jgi:sigma-B regulation protein RsbU (phosphoserine phosphatase)